MEGFSPEDEGPKSAYETILERLQKKDRENGVEERPLSAEQKERIAGLVHQWDPPAHSGVLVHDGPLDDRVPADARRRQPFRLRAVHLLEGLEVGAEDQA